ncbi:hypothetical protein GQ54DRAFT_70073 [Martensiomyces pterosporus]|nr:hypothetical protein GQ54DRAFT_70073 [Martensiomyces pterosporus]
MPLLPLLYRDLVFEFRRIKNCSTRHNAALANSAGCSEYVQRVSLFTNRDTDPDDIIKAVRDDMVAGNEAQWPNLRSYTYNNIHRFTGVDSFSCSDIIRQLDKELPKLRQVSPNACDMSSDIIPLAYTPLSASFLTQLTSLCLDCRNQGIDANRLPPLFAPTLVDLTLGLVNPENVWNAFYDGQEGQTVVFAKLKRLVIRFENPLYWEQNGELPPHLQDVRSDELAKRSVWTARAASGEPACRVPLFPVLRTLTCDNMVYNFHDFISRTQCHNNLVSLLVGNKFAYFDFDAKLFKSLQTVEFDAGLWSSLEEYASSVDLYKSAFTNLLHAKTNLQRMAFKADARDTIFQVPPDIGCVNLRSLCLGVEVDFESMLRLLGSLKHLVELELSGNREFTYGFDDGRRDTAEDTDELQPLHANYPPVSNTLRHFACCLHSPGRRRCYTAAYALELALHLPALENMTLSVSHEADVDFYKTLLKMFIEKLSGSPYMNDGLLNAKVILHSSIPWF